MPEGQLVSVLGAECTGKSTVCAALAIAPGPRWLPEYLREFVAQHGRPPRADEQAAIVVRQREREAAAARAGGPVLVDAGALMVAIYSVHYFDDPSLLPAALEWQRQYPLTLVCDTDLPWQADGVQRDGIAVRDRCQQRLLGLLRTHEIEFTLLRGDLPARLATARAALAARVAIPSAPR